MESSRILVWTDGSCLGNPGAGGWAYIVKDGMTGREEYGRVSRTTNNRMEITAAIKALQSLAQRPASVVLYSDSHLLVKTMANGWKRKKNLDLWSQLDELSTRHHITWQWVKGHSGHVENERCDKLAQQAAGAVKKT